MRPSPQQPILALDHGQHSSPGMGYRKPIIGTSNMDCREGCTPIKAHKASKIYKQSRGLKFFYKRKGIHKKCMEKPSAVAAKNKSQLETAALHAHSDWTRATVHGPIFVYPPKGKQYPFARPDVEIPIVLASWFKGDVMQIIKEALATRAEPNKSDAFTINGQPGDTQPCSNTTNQSASHYYIAARAFAGVVHSNATTIAVFQYSGNYTPSSTAFPNLPDYNNNLAVTSFVRGFRALASTDHLIDVPKSIQTRLFVTISINT
ncbi:hypothetical protein Ancab_034306 [Ancistrocladus abbreviatus]